MNNRWLLNLDRFWIACNLATMKSLGILAFFLIAFLGGLFVWNWYGFHRMKTGYEVKTSDYSSYLKAKISDDLGYGGFDPRWLQEAWMNGYQDHTYLFVVVADTSSLRDAIEKATGTDPIQLSYFRNGGYLGPSTAPQWWDTARIDAAEARYFQKNSDLWRFTWINDQLYIVYSN